MASSRGPSLYLQLAGALALATLIPAFTDQAQAPPARIAVKNGNVTLEAWIWRPEGPGPFPAVLVNHGSGRTREELERLGPYEQMAERVGPVSPVPVGRTPDDGHDFPNNSVATWEPDVFAFLDSCMR